MLFRCILLVSLLEGGGGGVFFLGLMGFFCVFFIVVEILILLIWFKGVFWLFEFFGFVMFFVEGGGEVGVIVVWLEFLSDGSFLRMGGFGGGVVGRGVIEIKIKSKLNNEMLVINYI